MALETILEVDGEALTRQAIEMALGRDGPAMRLCLERLYPARKDRPIVCNMPKIETVSDLPKATSAIMEAMAGGEITTSEASDVSKVVDEHVKALEITDLAERLARLEASR